MALLSIGEILDLGNSANMSSFIPYSALDYNPTGAISGISGSAIAGGVDSSVVSSIVSSMVSSKMDVSASGFLQPSGDYAYNSALSSYLPASASGDFITSTAGLAPSGDYAYNSALSSYLPASASGDFITSTAGLAPSGDYAFNSSVSAKLDASASSQFIVNSSLSSYVAYSSIGGEDSHITSISGSAIGGSIPPTTQLILDGATMSGLIDPETQDFYIGVKSGVFASDSGMSAYATTAYVNSSISSKLDASAFTSYTSTYAPVVIVGNSSEATAANVVYVVTGIPV